MFLPIKIKHNVCHKIDEMAIYYILTHGVKHFGKNVITGDTSFLFEKTIRKISLVDIEIYLLSELLG